MQSWHLDSNDFWVVGFGAKLWRPALRRRYYILFDTITRHTVQVYPNSWIAILVPLNKGMWNLRFAIWPRQYLGQQLYIKVWIDEKKSLYRV
ncbi:hypothetical protein GIB67_009327 [Kingdonia uniflora]|uniref:Plastocyanin-like domain-containing protein n=1 Tax=Kingdonia uniflora TaxID=39325 RepID=A0A7J7N3G7_9MAGN|nr:hypothetical protein GIB67_009327 [Kingdonia uniflora]